MLWRTKKTTVVEHSPSASFSLSEQGGANPEKRVGEVENRDEVNTGDLSREQRASARQGVFVIPRGYKISGALVTSRSVIVEGELVGGSVFAPSVNVLKGGYLGAPTQARLVDVSGVVDGAVSAREGVVVRQGGEVRGQLEAGALSIAPGGVISGARLAIGPLR